MQGSIHLFERMPQIDARPVAANDHALSVVRSNPLVGLIRNARSHRNAGGGNGGGDPEGVIVTTPRRRNELPGILQDFAARGVDCVAIDGGDGTVRDVLTCGAGIFGDSWPVLIVLPNGKTNALALDLGIPVGWTLNEALEALRLGHAVRRKPIVITQCDDPTAQVRGFIMGAGVFNRTIALGQRSHDLGAFNAAAIGMTAVWSVLQAMFGGRDNPWRRGTKMRLRDGSGVELPHHGGLPVEERFFLFASTLENFPFGIDPFRGISESLRVALLDNPRRSLLLRILALARGTASAATMRRGAHALGTEALEMELSDSFILDGEAFPAGHYRMTTGAKLRFVVP